MDYIGKGEMLMNRDVNKYIKNERNKVFVHMEHFWDLSFQFMEHGTNTLHVVLIILFCVKKKKSSRKVWHLH